MKHFLTILLLVFSSIIFGQNQDNTLSQLGKVNLGLHGLEISYERPISNSLVWENALGAGMSANVIGNAAYYFDLSRPTPFVKSELKYIYNRNKRQQKGKKIANNSGNYLGLQTKYSFGNSNNYQINEILLTEIHWGIQRALGRKFLFNAHIGLGYIKDFDTRSDDISPTAGIRFGYILL